MGISTAQARQACWSGGHFWTEKKGEVVCAQCGQRPRRPIDLETGLPVDR